MIRFAVPAQVDAGERRVSLTPSTIDRLVEEGHEVWIESGAGAAAGHDDDAYRSAGAGVADLGTTVAAADVVVMVNGPRPGDDTASAGSQQLWSMLGPQHTVVGLHDPLWQPDHAAKLVATGATVVALDLLPRITRAQSMDVLSSMATVAGYQAALLAAERSPVLLPLLMTAAGTVPAAKVLVLGAGVAGLQAIATARRLGAVVTGYDIRPAAVEQILSLGARTVDVADDAGANRSTEDEGGYARRQDDDTNRAQHELLAPHVAEADVVITTAAVPGAASPRLITADMVSAMERGSVVVDLAAERGGNCEVTVADEEVVHDGVLVLGPTDLASRAAGTASQLFANNVLALITHLAPEGDLVIDTDDEITGAIVVGAGGEVLHPRVVEALGR